MRFRNQEEIPHFQSKLHTSCDMTFSKALSPDIQQDHVQKRLLSSRTPSAKSVNCIFVNIRESIEGPEPCASFLWSWDWASATVLADSNAFCASRRACTKHELEFIWRGDWLLLREREDFRRCFEVIPGLNTTCDSVRIPSIPSRTSGGVECYLKSLIFLLLPVLCSASIQS